MFGGATCDLCDIIITFRSRKQEKHFTGLCRGCRKDDKLRNPIKIIRRVLREKSLESLTPFEEFTVFYSGIITSKKLHRKHFLINKLYKRLLDKFEF